MENLSSRKVGTLGGFARNPQIVSVPVLNVCLTLLTACLTTLHTQYGFVHGDLHPGNVTICRIAQPYVGLRIMHEGTEVATYYMETDGKFPVIIDFGMSMINRRDSQYSARPDYFQYEPNGFYYAPIGNKRVNSDFFKVTQSCAEKYATATGSSGFPFMEELLRDTRIGVFIQQRIAAYTFTADLARSSRVPLPLLLNVALSLYATKTRPPDPILLCDIHVDSHWFFEPPPPPPPKPVRHAMRTRSKRE